MKKIMLIISSALLIFGETGNIYNCVDCSYSNPSYSNSLPFASQKKTKIVHQQPEDIKVLIQNYSCDNCGLFEISIRKKARTQQDIKNR